MMTPTRPASLELVVGYDGSDSARRALDAAVRLLQNRVGQIDVVYVAQLASVIALSPTAVADMESDFNDIERELRATAAEQLRDREATWGFARRQGVVADELIRVATEISDACAERTVVIVVGSSAHAAHRVLGSVAAGLARRSPVPLVVVP
jgi:nucleotide-binding universal stress UspA family protein